MRKYNIDKEFLVREYVERGKSLSEVADMLGVSRQTIANKLKEHHLSIRPTNTKKKHRLKLLKPCKKKLWRNKEDFQRVYSELKALDLVAKHYGINITTACDWKLKHGIGTIKAQSYVGEQKRNDGKPYTNEDWLRKMYAKYSYTDIAKRFNCSPSTISKWGQRFGIKPRTLSEQWDLKSKNGGHVVLDTRFDLQEYKETYILQGISHLPKKLRGYIISLYGKCEACGYSEVLDLHHIDNNHSNNNFDNHSVLCPNCHAKIHRLGIPFDKLVSNHITWDKLIDSYQEAK